MPIYHSKKFQESALAHQLLDGLTGLEIGGAAHNAFGLDTLNVDRVHYRDPTYNPYVLEQIQLCGEVMNVDIVAPGDCIPVDDKSFDFVINSHVIEHFYDPIAAIMEWLRISRQYVFMIVPQRDALESDKDKELTTLEDHIKRHSIHNTIKDIRQYRYEKLREVRKMKQEYESIANTDEHHSRWTCRSFIDMCIWILGQPGCEGWQVVAMEDPDRKVGNGFTVVLKYIG